MTTLFIWVFFFLLIGIAVVYSLSQTHPKGKRVETSADATFDEPSSPKKPKSVSSETSSSKLSKKDKKKLAKSTGKKDTNKNEKNQKKPTQPNNQKKGKKGGGGGKGGNNKGKGGNNKAKGASKGITAALKAFTAKQPAKNTKGKKVDLSEHHDHFTHGTDGKATRDPRHVALQFGLLYKGTEFELKGCVNDLNNIYEHFLKANGFTAANTILLTDDTKITPTKRNMQAAMKQFVQKSVNGDHLFLQYSGHGTSVKDMSGDETDGIDEALCPLDGGVIIDDWLFENVVKGFEDKPKTSLFIMVDACHSGTCFDLQHQYFATRGDKPTVRQHHDRLPSRACKGHVLAFSAAMDDQTAVDIQDGAMPQGAFTAMFLEVYASHVKKRKTFRNFILELDALLAKSGYHHQASLNSTHILDLDSECHFWC